MHEQEWSTSTSLQAMLDWLPHGDRASQRKLRLFGCACVRRVGSLLVDEGSRKIVEVAERFADGLASRAELQRAVVAAPGIQFAYQPTGEAPEPPGFALEVAHINAAAAAHEVANAAAHVAARGAAASSSAAIAWHVVADVAQRFTTITPAWYTATRDAWHAAADAEAGRQCCLLRDVFGPLPFQQMTIEASWQTPAVVALARGIYDRKLFTLLAELAQALEAAGCSDAALLGHLRAPGPHVRGCWPVDLILDKR